MRCIKIIVFSLIMILFVQCKPRYESMEEDDNNNQSSTVSFNGKVMMPKTRFLMDTLGHLTWISEKSFSMLYSRKQYIAGMHCSADSSYKDNYIFATSKLYMEPSADYLRRMAFFTGMKKQLGQIINMNFDVQYGDLEKVWYSFFGTIDAVGKLNENMDTYEMPPTKLRMVTSVARIKMPQYDCESYYLKYEGCITGVDIGMYGERTTQYPYDTTMSINEMEYIYVYRYGDICIQRHPEDAYVVLYPQTEPIPNTVVEVYADTTLIGTINFPNGIRSNKLYVGGDGGAIKINGRGTVVEEDLFVEE